MKHAVKIFQVGIMVSLLIPYRGTARNTSGTMKVHTDFAYLSHDKLRQDIYYSSDSAYKGSLQIACYKFRKENDSVLVYAKKNIKANFKKGAHTLTTTYSKTDSNVYFLQSFYNVLDKTALTPPGLYKTFITIEAPGILFSTFIVNTIDSNLAYNSPIRKRINSTLLPGAKSFLGISFGSRASNLPGSKALENASKKMDKALKSEGLVSVQHGNMIDLYCQDWYLGRYEAPKEQSISVESKLQQSLLDNKPASLTDNGLDGHTSLFSQFRELKKEKKKDDLTGEISLQQNVSNGQEQYSDQDNNFYAVQGMVELPIAGMPVSFEGMYTSQDQNRQIKASYFRVHYDMDKAKDQLNELINSYKKKYNETVSKTKGLDQVYGSYLNRLEGQKAVLEQQIQHEPGMNTPQPNFDQLRQKATEEALQRNKQHNNGSNAAGDQKIKDSIDNKYKLLEERYKRLQAIEKQIDKYSTLLTQARNINYFDSALVYDKVKDIQNTDQLSYKQLAKKADKLLPEGSAKKFATGITHFDAGIFPKYASSFTMSGQTMKGLDFGYDFGFVQAGLTIGNTEFIGRDGSVDKYFSYALNANCRPYEGQKIGLIYYTYLPSHAMLSDGFFKNMDIAAPSFTSPVHIVSATYDGVVSKYVTIQGELANSLNKRDSAIENNLSTGDKTAYNINVSGNVPNTYLTLEGSYSKAGKGFQNNTLPITPAGTEQYRIAARNEFFRSFLSLGVEYDYMLQSNFASSGGNKRFGFDIQTHTRRYPAVGLSYKPFSTFRSFADTLNIPQHPIIGSTWTGKASYQLKRTGGRAYRFFLIYNKNMSIMDTINYGSSLLQASVIYTYKQLMVSANAGQMQVSGTRTDTAGILPNNTKIFGLTASYTFNKTINVSAGQDIGIASFGLCKYSVNGSTAFRLNKLPIILRFYVRYSSYQAAQTQPWKNLYSGSIDLTWQFKTKLTTK